MDEPFKIPSSIDDVISSGEFGFGNGRQIRLEAIFHHGSGDHLFETPISTDQALVELGDGRLRLKATVADAQQLIWWLLGLGDGVEVVKPSELRRKMAQATEKMAQLYRQAW